MNSIKQVIIIKKADSSSIDKKDVKPDTENGIREIEVIPKLYLR